VDQESEAKIFITIIIPVRDEEGCIHKLLKDIENQTYPKNLLEVIVVDDHSTDRTVEIVEKYKSENGINLHLIKLVGHGEEKAHKKLAIEMAILQSKGELIVTTDGDCRVGTNWIRTIEAFYRELNYQMICGPVFFTSDGTFFQEMQQMEFASLIGSGAATLSLGFPTMCNGANLAYSKKAFYEVNGFQGNQDVSSGDDEFLMHKIYQKYPGKVKFLKSQDAIVNTHPKTSIAELLNQRKRWASKWSYYQTVSPKILAGAIFLFNITLVFNSLLVLVGEVEIIVFFQQILPKILLEFVFLRMILTFSGKKINVLAFIFLEFIYPIYVISVVLLGFRKGYNWKGRTINN
jgi:cellulose synthase/poly-beta-1,6-N-acetylglucosamine synthase-like glycosyltransferase